jgi:lysine 2,3-aminomutase
MAFKFPSVTPRSECSLPEWQDWTWQFKNSLKTQADFSAFFHLSEDEKQGFTHSENLFKSQVTPYYASLVNGENPLDPVRQILMPRGEEVTGAVQEMLDPLGERKPENRKAARIIHRYSDRVLFLLTDLCSVYCRFCTRKHFTGKDQAFINNKEYEEAISYIKSHPGVREVIFSGGDPLTLSDGILDRVISDVRAIDHIEVIRVHSRMPVVCPMRITDNLVKIFKKNKPVYLITHFNHPKEITQEAAESVEKLVDSGIPVLNQMVLLNGINNHEAIVQALSRRLLFLRVKPYYMFQCDPSEGTDHLRNSIDDSLKIQRALWGHLSGLAMPTYIVDLPSGGGKAALTPDFEVPAKSPPASSSTRHFVGWDGVAAEYKSPSDLRKPIDVEDYLAEWHLLKNAKQS